MVPEVLFMSIVYYYLYWWYEFRLVLVWTTTICKSNIWR